MRHGKSSWDLSVADQDRSLQERGIADAYAVAKEFSNLNIKIDACFSSPANRALHTGIIAARVLLFPMHKFYLTKELYDFSGNSVIEFVKNLENTLNTVLIFGHNQAFTEIVNLWGNQYIENVPTAGLVQLNFGIDKWRAIDKGKTQTVLFPKQLKK